VVDEGVRSCCCCGLETRLGFLALTLDVRRAMLCSVVIAESISWEFLLLLSKPLRILDVVRLG
jgi:hypothetical protein